MSWNCEQCRVFVYLMSDYRNFAGDGFGKCSGIFQMDFWGWWGFSFFLSHNFYLRINGRMFRSFNDFSH